VVSDLGQALDSRQVAERRLVRTDADGEAQSLLPVWIDGAPPPLRTALREEAAMPADPVTPGHLAAPDKHVSLKTGSN
jgi:hypothetical protein